MPPNIVTQDDLIAWLKSDYPYLSGAQIQAVLDANPSSSAPVNPNATRTETNGYGPPYALNVSQAGTGQQQRAYVCVVRSSRVCSLTNLAAEYICRGNICVP